MGERALFAMVIGAVGVTLIAYGATKEKEYNAASKEDDFFYNDDDDAFSADIDATGKETFNYDNK